MVDESTLLLIKDITGYTSTTLLALLYIPQTIWVYYQKDSQGLTWTFLIIGLILTTDTIVYGALLYEPPLIAANIIAMICMIFLIIAKCIWKTKPPLIIEEVTEPTSVVVNV